MRKRIIGTVLLALIGVLILAALNVNFLVQRNQDYLLGRLAQTLGRRVSADKIDVTFASFGAHLVNVAIADDPAFSAGELLRAKSLKIQFRLLPLLIGQLRLKKIVLESPLITIVRGTEGRYNFESQAGDEKSEREGADRNQKASTTKHDGYLSWVASLQVSDGTLRYRDLKNGGELALTQINLNVSDFESDAIINIQLDAAVMAAKPNLKFNNRIGPIEGIQDYRDFPIDGAIHADALDLGKVNRALPQFRKSLPRQLRFDGIYDIKDLKFKGTLNRLSLKGAISGTDASVRFE